MRLIACFAVVATSFLALRANFPAVSAAEDAAASLPKQQSAPDTLATRVYHLKHIATSDLRSMIEPWLSQRGKIEIPQADRNAIVVHDHENVLKIIDRVVAERDIQPKQVLIEATIVRVDSYKVPRAEAGSSILDRAAECPIGRQKQYRVQRSRCTSASQGG